MLLSEYDRTVVLCVDRRLEQEGPRLLPLLDEKGIQRNKLKWFIDGEGQMYPALMYDQITPTPPASWRQSVGAYAHFCAMKAVVQKAKDDGVDTLLWIEDDCVFTEGFDQIVAAATEQLSSLPPWDLLYYGANHTWANTEELSPNVLRCFGSYTTHLLGIRSSVFDRILRLPPVHVIDNVIANTLHHANRCYAIWPNVALQKPGYSHISNMMTDYTHYFDCKGSNHL